MLPEEIRGDAGLFWDAKPGEIDPGTNAPYVIGRVLSLGTLQQVRALLRFYGWDRLRSFFRERGLRHVDRRATCFWLLVLDLAREECERKSSLPPSQTSWSA